MADAAWRAEFERGRAAGTADRAAGRSAVGRPDFWQRPRAFRAGYEAGHEPDEPAEVPVAPAFALLEVSASAALTAAWRQRRHTGSHLVALTAWGFAFVRLHEAARRRRAQRLGYRRRADAPPDPPASGIAAARLATTIALRWDARRRGTWPLSAWTRVGLAMPAIVETEVRWRRWAASWDAGS